MASNGLVANPKKTSFVIFNQKARKDEIISIKIGNDLVCQEKSAKLLGLTFDSNQGWQTQIYGPGGVIMSLNKRLFIIRRLQNHLSNDSLLKLVDGIFTSKIRYGLQLLGKVRLQPSDPNNIDLDNIQKVQNKLVRLLTKTKLTDRVNIASLLKKTNMMSVNQMNGQIKIQEIWKSLNVSNYPIQVNKQTPHASRTSTRADVKGRLIETGNSCLSQKTCINDAIRIWNQLPISVTDSTSFYQIKKHAKLYAKSLPI